MGAEQAVGAPIAASVARRGGHAQALEVSVRAALGARACGQRVAGAVARSTRRRDDEVVVIGGVLVVGRLGGAHAASIVAASARPCARAAGRAPTPTEESFVEPRLGADSEHIGKRDEEDME